MRWRIRTTSHAVDLHSRSMGILPLHFGTGVHRALIRRGQDGLATQGRDALATKNAVAKPI